MADTLHLEIVTPEACAYSDEVNSVVLPAMEGEMKVLPSHLPLLTMIKPGELQVDKQGERLSLAIGEGFVEITAGHVHVLSDMALRADEIDEAAVEQALERAKEALSQKHDPAETAALEGMIQKSIAQLSLKRKRRF